jgi:hypothetical protein
MGIGKTSVLPLFFLSEPTDPTDSPETSDPFKSLICLKTYPAGSQCGNWRSQDARLKVIMPQSSQYFLNGIIRCLPMWKLAFPGARLKILFIHDYQKTHYRICGRIIY